ncbi:MAG TPA: hypothetical protein PKW79_06335 [Rhabdochlamydiaceae bacterium]|nr:hypothetical protein [Rhabdochlamydiaceae bacterium]
MVQRSDFLLAWQLQIQEYMKASKSAVVQAAQTIGTVLCYEVPHYPRFVKGDGDCFFHAVNRPTLLNRVSLVKRLLGSSTQEVVRQGFAHEIRQFLYLGCVGGLNSDNDQAAFAKIVTTQFKSLVESLNHSEEALRKLITRVRDLHGVDETQGKNAEGLIVFLESQQSPLSQEFKAAYKIVTEQDHPSCYLANEE